MNEIISELSKIDEDILNERAFYEKIFYTLKKLINLNLNDADLNELKVTLRSIGCKELEEIDDLADTTIANTYAAKLFISEFLKSTSSR